MSGGPFDDALKRVLSAHGVRLELVVADSVRLYGLSITYRTFRFDRAGRLKVRQQLRGPRTRRGGHIRISYEERAHLIEAVFTDARTRRIYPGVTR